jgi:hypothetical protein
MALFRSDFGHGEEVVFQLNLKESFPGKVLSVEFHQESGVSYGILTKTDDGPERVIYINEGLVAPGNTLLLKGGTLLTAQDEPIFEHSERLED